MSKPPKCYKIVFETHFSKEKPSDYSTVSVRFSEPAITKACDHGIENRSFMLGTHQIDKTNQSTVFFQNDEDKATRLKVMDKIKNRFKQKYITKGNTLL
jgi:hypothetical protein